MARETKATKAVSDDFSVITFTFSDGDEVLEVRPREFSTEIQAALLAHGVAQKLGDSYAGVDAAQAHVAAKAVLAALQEGKWSQRVEGSSGPRVSQLAEALAAVSGRTLDECVAKIATMTDEEKKGLRSHPSIVQKLAEIKLLKAQEAARKAAEKAAAAGDVGTLSF
jgi:hypothetical protein